MLLIVWVVVLFWFVSIADYNHRAVVYFEYLFFSPFFKHSRTRAVWSKTLKVKLSTSEFLSGTFVLVAVSCTVVCFSTLDSAGNHRSSLPHCLSVCVVLIELTDPNLGMGASGTQASGGTVVPKGTNKRRIT